MGQALWETQIDGSFATDSGELRLVVHRLADTARFVVLRRSVSGAADILVGSGTSDTVLIAMEAAERMAARFRRSADPTAKVAAPDENTEEGPAPIPPR